MDSAKVIGIIPARYASRRFPGKMLADILGTSLIERTYINAKRASICDVLVVATDDRRIYDHVKGFGGEVVMSSPDAPSGSDRAAEVIETYYPNAEIVVIIQGDEPCLDPSIITTLVRDLHDNPLSHMATPVEPIVDPEEIVRPGIVKCIFDDQKKAIYFSRAPIPYLHHPDHINTIYYRHIGVYCFRKEFLLKYPQLPATRLQKIEDLEQLKIIEHGFSIYVSIVPPQGVIGVDYPEDITKVEAFLCRENLSLSPAASSLL